LHLAPRTLALLASYLLGSLQNFTLLNQALLAIGTIFLDAPLGNEVLIPLRHALFTLSP
jgi:hypothetical protein